MAGFGDCANFLRLKDNSISPPLQWQCEILFLLLDFLLGWHRCNLLSNAWQYYGAVCYLFTVTTPAVICKCPNTICWEHNMPRYDPDPPCGHFDLKLNTYLVDLWLWIPPSYLSIEDATNIKKFQADWIWKNILKIMAYPMVFIALHLGPDFYMVLTNICFT